MTSHELINLYKSDSLDENLTPLSDSTGFTLVRNYDKNSRYFSEGKKMFIRLFISKRNFIHGSIDMVKPNKEETGETTYSIISDQVSKPKITNFSIEEDDKISFNGTKILYLPKNIEIDLNKFVEILVKNHLTDRLFFKRQKNRIANSTLRLLFWLSDKHYEKVSVLLNTRNSTSNNKHDVADNTDTEPFFKYFHIPRNTLLILFCLFFSISSLLLNHLKDSYYTLSNPSLVLFVFLVLFITEKVSMRLNVKIKAFFDRESNFISKLHKYQYYNEFKLKYFI